MDTADWATIGVMLAIGGLLWRQTAALAGRVDALDARLTAAVGAVDARLTAVEVRLTAAIGDVDRRLARLEGWIEGERAGRSAGGPAAESTDA